jgi:hypothetical protein
MFEAPPATPTAWLRVRAATASVQQPSLTHPLGAGPRDEVDGVEGLDVVEVDEDEDEDEDVDVDVDLCVEVDEDVEVDENVDEDVDVYVNVDVEVDADEDEDVDVEVLTVPLAAKKFSRLGPPQISFALPAHAMLQLVLPSGAGPPPF